MSQLTDGNAITIATYLPVTQQIYEEWFTPSTTWDAFAAALIAGTKTGDAT